MYVCTSSSSWTQYENDMWVCAFTFRENSMTRGWKWERMCSEWQSGFGDSLKKYWKFQNDFFFYLVHALNWLCNAWAIYSSNMSHQNLMKKKQTSIYMAKRTKCLWYGNKIFGNSSSSLGVSLPISYDAIRFADHYTVWI